VVAGEEGYVRKISVRSTEVETFDRARVLVPNSYLITEKLKNWTLRDNIRRIVIPVEVAHGCNARNVKALLLNVARDNADVMPMPAPSVELEEFGADGLRFKLCAFIHDLTKAGSISTELRMAILDAFNEAGIRTPSRGTDITLQNMDWLREALTQYAGSYNGRSTARNGSPAAQPLAGHQDESVLPAARSHRNGGRFPA
jgi:potassium-dependent mechanosensitive channel